MKKKVSLIIIITIFSLLGVYNYLPFVLAKYHETKSINDLNLVVKKVKYEKNYFEYMEGGEGDTILLVHGFQSSKSYWLPYIKQLVKNHHVIALDLPGHGNTPNFKTQKYDLYSIADSLHHFVKAKGLDHFHLMGTSMGGGITAIYAYNNPDYLLSLTMINPLGIDQEKKSDLQILLDQGKNLFFPEDLEEFNKLTIYCTGREMSISSYFKKYVIKQMNKKYAFFKEAFNQMLTTTPLDKILPKIKTKSLILIGQKDKIIHPASFEHFVRLMPNVKPVRLKNGSHVFVDDSFKEAIKEIKDFLDKDS